MKKTIVITCVGSLMGVALLSAVADDPAPTSTSPRARSLYQEAPPWAQPNSLSAAVGLTAAEEDEASCEACLEVCEDAQPASDVVTAGGGVAAESEEPAVVHASEESAENEASDIVQVQGTTRGLYGSDDRLIRPISTQSPTRSGTSLHPEPATSPEPASDFSWATPSTVPAPAPQGNPFARQPAATFPSAPVDSTELPAPPAAPISAEESQISTPAQPQPSRFTVTQGASSAPEPQTSSTPRGVVVSSFTSSETVGQSQAPDVRLEWRRGGEINVGQETTCLLAVHNHGSATAKLIEVTAIFPRSVRLLSSQPVPDHTDPVDASGSRLSWYIAQLAPGSETVFEVALIPLERGEIAAQAEVRFTSQTSGVFTVSEPLLEVTIEGPASVLVGEPASQIVTISNPGTGVATHVELEALIPEGLEHSRGSRLLMDLGSLNPGESRSVRLALAAVRGGDHVVNVQARADASLVDTAASQLSVIAPNLIAEIDGPGLRYLGRQAIYTLSVVNDGSVPTDNVRVMHKIPEGFRFISSDQGAQFDEANSLLNWFAGRLDRGQSAQLHVTLEATAAGEFTHFVRATSENGAVCDTQISTTIEGTSSLALELRDIDDPVELGTEAAYEIVVRNEGTAAAGNVGIWCELPAGVDFSSASGPSEHRLENGSVYFRPLAQLAPGESATYRVIVNAQVLGNHRLRAHLSSDSISEPLTDEELTKFYGE